MCGRCATRDVSPWDGCWYEAQKEQPPRRPLPAAGRLHFPKGEKEERKNADDLDPPTAAPRAARTCKVRVVKKEPFPPRKDHFPAVPEEKWIIPGDSRVVKVARPREVAVPEEIAEQQFGAPEEQGAAKVDGDDAARSETIDELAAEAPPQLSPLDEAALIEREMEQIAAGVEDKFDNVAQGITCWEHRHIDTDQGITRPEKAEVEEVPEVEEAIGELAAVPKEIAEQQFGAARSETIDELAAEAPPQLDEELEQLGPQLEEDDFDNTAQGITRKERKQQEKMEKERKDKEEKKMTTERKRAAKEKNRIAVMMRAAGEDPWLDPPSADDERAEEEERAGAGELGAQDQSAGEGDGAPLSPRGKAALVPLRGRRPGPRGRGGRPGPRSRPGPRGRRRQQRITAKLSPRSRAAEVLFEREGAEQPSPRSRAAEAPLDEQVVTEQPSPRSRAAEVLFERKGAEQETRSFL